MNPGHADVGRIAGVRKNNPLVSIAALGQLVVATPSIGQNRRAWVRNLTNERDKAGAGHIRYPAHSHSSKPLGRMNFYRDHHDLLPFATAASFATHPAAAHLGFIHFNASAESISTRTYHGAPQFVQPRPSGLLTPKAKHAFQS